jgi:hypothetical protein
METGSSPRQLDVDGGDLSGLGVAAMLHRTTTRVSDPRPHRGIRDISAEMPANPDIPSQRVTSLVRPPAPF